jgi:hypothetical protein
VNISSALTLKEYVEGLKSFYAILGGLCAALPLTNFFTPWSLFPPLWETAQSFAIAGTAILLVIVIFGIYFAKDNSFLCRKDVRVLVFIVLGLITAAGLYWHIPLRARYVRYLNDPNDPKKPVAVSIGDVRSSDENMVNAYKGKNDTDMLTDYGVTDNDINTLYTPDSVKRCRMALWLSFLLPALSFAAFAGFGILYTAFDKAEQKAGALPPLP